MDLEARLQASSFESAKKTMNARQPAVTQCSWSLAAVLDFVQSRHGLRTQRALGLVLDFEAPPDIKLVAAGYNIDSVRQGRCTEST